MEARRWDCSAALLRRIDAPRRAEAMAWKGLMDAHHPLGSGPLCGAVLCYPIVSDCYGLLGGMAFSRAAWRVRGPRTVDRLGRRHAGGPPAPGGQPEPVSDRPACERAPSGPHVLALALPPLAGDWQARYGVRPVLVETFVDPEAYAGTGYRAANRTDLGLTAGRGRQDRHHHQGVSRKRVCAFPLVRAGRRALGVAGPVPVPVRDWAAAEVGDASLGDRCPSARLVTLLRDFYARPYVQIPEACGSRAKRTAAYRFFAHPHTTMEPILRAHAEATRGRLRRHPVVLAVQDSTALKYTGHPATDGLGPIGTRATKARGLWVHDTLAFTPDGTPLGRLDVQRWSRDPQRAGSRATRDTRAIDAQESAKWLKSFAAARTLQGACPHTRVVSVADREGDLYPLWQKAVESGAPARLMRAGQDRKLASGGERLRAFLARQPVAGGQTLHLPRRHGKRARVAHMEIRFAAVRLAPPPRLATAAPVPAWAVWTREIDLPAGETLDVSCRESFDKARWKALVVLLRRHPAPLTTPPTLEDAVRMVAQFGGDLGRQEDPSPGPQTLWRGLQRLDDLPDRYRLLTTRAPRRSPAAVMGNDQPGGRGPIDTPSDDVPR
jgi:hypothetical protein